jgi:hypothetical protein
MYSRYKVQNLIFERRHGWQYRATTSIDETWFLERVSHAHQTGSLCVVLLVRDIIEFLISSGSSGGTVDGYIRADAVLGNTHEHA